MTADQRLATEAAFEFGTAYSTGALALFDAVFAALAVLAAGALACGTRFGPEDSATGFACTEAAALACARRVASCWRNAFWSAAAC